MGPYLDGRSTQGLGRPVRSPDLLRGEGGRIGHERLGDLAGEMGLPVVFLLIKVSKMPKVEGPSCKANRSQWFPVLRLPGGSRLFRKSATSFFFSGLGFQSGLTGRISDHGVVKFCLLERGKDRFGCLDGCVACRDNVVPFVYWCTLFDCVDGQVHHHLASAQSIAWICATAMSTFLPPIEWWVLTMRWVICQVSSSIRKSSTRPISSPMASIW